MVVILPLGCGIGNIKLQGADNVKHQTTSEATPVLTAVQPATNATLDLLASWRFEDSKPTPDQIRAAEEELCEFKRAMNENRTSAGELILYP